MRKIGLFFGSFNPVHVGHLIIANFMANNTDLDELWMVVSPHNPHKKKSTLANNYIRLDMINLAIEDNPKLKSSNVEFSLPVPSYTVDTLAYLKEKHAEKDFVLIMGGDNLKSFHKWKNHEVILENHEIYVYQRPTHNIEHWEDHPKVKLFEAPLMQISSSFIRKSIKEGKSIKYLVTPPVFDYLNQSNLYRK